MYAKLEESSFLTRAAQVQYGTPIEYADPVIDVEPVRAVVVSKIGARCSGMDRTSAICVSGISIICFSLSALGFYAGATTNHDQNIAYFFAVASAVFGVVYPCLICQPSCYRNRDNGDNNITI